MSKAAWMLLCVVLLVGLAYQSLAVDVSNKGVQKRDVFDPNNFFGAGGQGDQGGDQGGDQDGEGQDGEGQDGPAEQGDGEEGDGEGPGELGEGEEPEELEEDEEDDD